MNLKRSIFYFPLIVTLFFNSCSTTKKRILNQEYHTLTTKFNVLFNGKEAFSIGEEILSDAFEENFYELLPVEPINLRGENIDETTIIPGFDRAEEKAVKAIQKHSLKINDIQYNRQIDDAYLLLGKARYFDRRFFPALEAFNFLLESPTNRNSYVEGKIWREKTNIRLRNEELAIENLRPLARSIFPSNKFYSLANATLAESFLNLKQLDSASFYIKRAALEAPKRKNKARYLFITGQLFESLGKRDSAEWAFKEIIALKRKAPKKFLLQAKIKKTLLDTLNTLTDRVSFLQKILKNYENQTFEHFVNRAIGNLYLKQKEDSLALVYFDRSIDSPYLDPYTQIENNKDLADYHFKEGNYFISGNYLDKLLPLFDETSLAFKKIKRKRENLSGVIFYEQNIKQTDSIIYLMTLSKKEQLIYFENLINSKQEKEALKLKEEVNEKRFQLLNRSKTSFYFYNPSQVSKGRQAYLANWGNRPNTDNWRNASSILNSIVIESKSNQPISIKAIIQEKPENFVASLPQTQKEKDSLILTNQKAYLQIGLIYKEKFNDFPLATERLKKVLSLNPPKEIRVQALYHLYRMEEKKKTDVAENYKIDLIKNYPDTPFARILSDQKNYNSTGTVTPEKLYENALKLYKEQKLIETLEEIELLTVMASGKQLESKISLLKANSLGRLNGIQTWKESLMEVATTFSAFEEGIYAKGLINQIEKLNNLEDTGVVYKNYKWIFPFKELEREKTEIFFNSLKEVLAKHNKRWTLSIDTYNKDYIFVVVHGIRDPKNIEMCKAKMQFKSSNLLKEHNFVALTSQYQDYLKNKTWKNKL
ncbi:MAG: tetratricopeptide repeat protein [Flavobacteriaceae bacterium]